MGKRRREYDEDDVRVRPARSSRPRTRHRPSHDEAVEAMVTEVHLGRYVCVTADATVTAMRARELGRRSVAVGDRVWLVGEVSDAPDALARIVRISGRRSELRRSPDDETDGGHGAGRGPGASRASGPGGRSGAVVVANADQLVIVSALADPPPRTGFIDRCLVAAYDADIDPLLCLTKADLVAGDGDADPAPVAALRDYYAALELRYVLCRPDRPLDELLTTLHGRMSVLVGHSGVGKSTLVNRLVPDAARAVGTVSAVTGKGRHVSSSAVALPLGPQQPHTGTWIIDTPGVRSFGLAHVSADSLLDAFADLVEGSAECPPNCDHLESGCALDDWVAAGHADPRRLSSYRRLLTSRAGDT